MHDELQLDIATAPNRDSKHWKQSTITWGEIIRWKPASKKECGNYVLGKLTGPVRRKTTIQSRCAITIDIDSPDKDFLSRVRVVLMGTVAFIHTTFSSAPDDKRYRILVPLPRPVTPDEYVRATEVLVDRLGKEYCDPGSSEPERYMFKPSTQHPDWYYAETLDGDLIDVEELLADFTDDLSDSPIGKTLARHKRDPYGIDGAVGAFNRVYRELEDLIEAYDLPYEASGENRWHLVGARSVAGMGEVRGVPGVYYSHHVHDPAFGKACSAFDLVRLHRFGELDEGLSEQTPINKLPSFTAMLELAAEDEKVMLEMIGKDFSVSDAEEIDAFTWRTSLRYRPRSGALVDDIANWDIITEKEPIFKSLFFNAMTMSVEVDGELPWRDVSHSGATFLTTDRSALCLYLERAYKVRPARTYIDELITTTAMKRYRNPLKEYLEALTWDNTPRLETCLPGVTPTRYTRMVARKSLVAAVARILDPGCKWDHSLVLFGPEGLGKSYWIDRMSLGYSATLGRIDNKDTLLTMHRSWIMIADEGYSLRKADSDALKEFLTRTADIFRMPYDREALLYKRHCVIWSTTNDEIFLRRQEGNRRFLIVRCEEKVDFEKYTQHYIDQVWAEAVHLYKNGELLFLEEADAEVAKIEREQFIEEDAMRGVIEEFLDTFVPPDYEKWSPDRRQMWYKNRGDDEFEEPGSVQHERVCSTQIWVEALGGRIGDHKRQDLLQINTAMKQIPGWRALPSRHRLPHYGSQLVFERVDAETQRLMDELL